MNGLLNGTRDMPEDGHAVLRIVLAAEAVVGTCGGDVLSVLVTRSDNRSVVVSAVNQAVSTVATRASGAISGGHAGANDGAVAVAVAEAEAEAGSHGAVEIVGRPPILRHDSSTARPLRGTADDKVSEGGVADALSKGGDEDGDEVNHDGGGEAEGERNDGDDDDEADCLKEEAAGQHNS